MALVAPFTVFRTVVTSAFIKPDPLLSASDQIIRSPPFSWMSTFAESEMLPAALSVKLAVALVVTSASIFMVPEAEMSVEKLAK